MLCENFIQHCFSWTSFSTIHLNCLIIKKSIDCNRFVLFFWVELFILRKTIFVSLKIDEKDKTRVLWSSNSYVVSEHIAVKRKHELLVSVIYWGVNSGTHIGPEFISAILEFTLLLIGCLLVYYVRTTTINYKQERISNF